HCAYAQSPVVWLERGHQTGQRRGCDRAKGADRHQMTEALIVNPYSIEETSDAIRAALEMTLEERCERHGALLAGIKKHDAAAWSQSFLECLKRLRPTNDASSWRPPESIRPSLEQL